MSAYCGVCGLECKDDKQSIKCSGSCEKQFHIQCIKSEGIKTRTSNKDWKCDDCKRDSSSVGSNKSQIATTTITKEFILAVMEDFKKEMVVELKSYAAQMEECKASLQFMSDKVEQSNSLIQEVRKEYAIIKKNNEQLQEQNIVLNKSVTELKDRVRMLEQYTRKTNIEISGIPESPREDSISLLRDIGSVIGLELQDNQVMAAHRVPSYKKDRTPSLVVQFQNRDQRDAWITHYREKKIMTANEVNRAFPSNRVYINEHLSPENKLFLGQLKQKCKDLRIKYVWFREGKFFIRKNDGEKCHKISKMEDLSNIS